MKSHRRLITFSLLATLSVFTSSCDRKACKNLNPVFDQYPPESQEYKKELAKQMQHEGAENLSYWYNKSQEINGQEYLELFIQNDYVCAKGIIQVKDKTKRRGLQNNKGYSGAQLKGVAIKTEENAEGINFVLENIEKIID